MTSRPAESGALTRTVHRLLAADGSTLHLRHAEHPAPRARFLVLHGYGDHGGGYEHVADGLGERGFSVAAGDLRGHGESSGRRGHVDRFDDYLDDVDAMLTHVRERDQGRARIPLFLVGHSLGGLIAARHIQRRPGGLEGLILVAPFARLKFPVPSWKRGLARALSNTWPTFSLPTRMPQDVLTHDSGWREHHRDDPLVFSRATARWFTEAVAAQQHALATPPDATPPLLLLLAGEDRIVCNAAAHGLHAALQARDAEVREYPGLFHDLFHEVEHGQVIKDLADWVDGQLDRDGL